jgi:hypothetical protein
MKNQGNISPPNSHHDNSRSKSEDNELVERCVRIQKPTVKNDERSQREFK